MCASPHGLKEIASPPTCYAVALVPASKHYNPLQLTPKLTFSSRQTARQKAVANVILRRKLALRPCKCQFFSATATAPLAAAYWASKCCWQVE